MLKLSRLMSVPAMLAVAASLLATTVGARAQSSIPTIAADDRILGRADAPIAIFEFASLTCSHCAAFATGTLPMVKQEWIATGKAQLIFRDFPLDKLALQAAMLARCASRERYFDMIEALFKDQASWAQMPDPSQALDRIAGMGGLSKDQASTCLNDAKLSDFIVGERLTGSKYYGIEMTPSFFLNDIKAAGEKSYADFKVLLESAALRPRN